MITLKVYAHLLGSFVLLDNEKDMINGFKPHVFIEHHLHKYDNPFMFFTVIHDGLKYTVSYNQLQSCEPVE